VILLGGSRVSISQVRVISASRPTDWPPAAGLPMPRRLRATARGVRVMLRLDLDRLRGLELAIERQIMFVRAAFIARAPRRRNAL